MSRSIPVLMLALLLILPNIVFARPVTDAAFDSIRGGLVQVNNFFAGQQYQPYAKAIDFFFFSFLFIAIYMMGARYAFKEIKRPEQVIVILLGLMTAFLLVLANISVVALLPFIHWLFYVLLFALYWWLLKGIKNGFWRFILALLLTLLTIGLIQGLFNTLTAPQFGTIGAPDGPGFSWGGFGLGNFFKDWGGNFKGPSTAGWGDWLNGKKDSLLGTAQTTPSVTGPITSTTTPSGTTKSPPTGGGSTSGGGGLPNMHWWYVLFLLPLLFLIPQVRSGARKLLKRGPGGGGGGTEPTTQEGEENIDDLIREVSEWMAKKLEAIRKIRTVIQEKEALEENEDYLDLYHKKISDTVFYLDPERSEYKDLMRQHKEVTDVLKLELGLEKDLLKLMKLEDELIGRSQMPLFSFQREKFTGRVIEFTSRETQKEWYGKLDYWYGRLKKIEEYVQEEYNARLGIGQGVRNIDPLKRTTGEGSELTLGRADFYRNEDGTEVQGRPELEMPIGIPDFYGRIFGGLEYSFSILMGDKRGQISRLLNANDRNRVPPAKLSARSRAALEQFRGQPGLVVRIRRQIIQYYVWTKEEEKIEVTISLLTHAKELEKWLAKGWETRWHDIKDKEGQRLKKVFSDERKMFYGNKAEPGLFMNLVRQYRHLQRIKALLEALKRQKASMTQMQELYVSKEVQSGDSSKWIDVTSEAKKKSGILLDAPYSVHTRFKEGKGPFKVACYVNQQKKKVISVAARHDEAKFMFDEIGITEPGEYKITFFAVSPGADIRELAINQETGEQYPKYEKGTGTYERIDIKKIKIYVASVTTTPPPPGTPPPPTTPPVTPATSLPGVSIRPRGRIPISPLPTPPPPTGSSPPAAAPLAPHPHDLTPRIPKGATTPAADAGNTEQIIVEEVTQYYTHHDIDKLRKNLTEHGVNKFRFARSDKLEVSVADYSGTSYWFVEDEAATQWLLVDAGNGSDTWVAPLESSVVGFGRMSDVFRFMFDGFDYVPQQPKFEKLHQSARMQAVASEPGRYTLVAKGNISLVGVEYTPPTSRGAAARGAETTQVTEQELNDMVRWLMISRPEIALDGFSTDKLRAASAIFHSEHIGIGWGGVEEEIARREGEQTSLHPHDLTPPTPRRATTGMATGTPLYFELPWEEGKIAVEQLKDTNSAFMLYRLNPASEGSDTAEVAICENERAQVRAISNYRGYLSPLCNYRDLPNRNERIVMDRPGIMKLNGNFWELQKKIEIHFESPGNLTPPTEPEPPNPSDQLAGRVASLGADELNPQDRDALLEEVLGEERGKGRRRPRLFGP